jgi:hypothetical protein
MSSESEQVGLQEKEVRMDRERQLDHTFREVLGDQKLLDKLASTPPPDNKLILITGDTNNDDEKYLLMVKVKHEATNKSLDERENEFRVEAAKIIGATGLSDRLADGLAGTLTATITRDLYADRFPNAQKPEGEEPLDIALSHAKIMVDQTLKDRTKHDEVYNKLSQLIEKYSQPETMPHLQIATTQTQKDVIIWQSHKEYALKPVSAQEADKLPSHMIEDGTAIIHDVPEKDETGWRLDPAPRNPLLEQYNGTTNLSYYIFERKTPDEIKRQIQEAIRRYMGEQEAQQEDLQDQQDEVKLAA